jgi:LPPG:FO 2-phospho-L-lactate transferase
MKVVAFAGGVGGAKLAYGLARCLLPDQLSVIVNTGDDISLFGLKICPDLDTVCYTLAGLANEQTGWGLKDETWQAIGSVERLGGPGWFHLGDRDLGTHLERTRRLALGEPLSAITHGFCQAWGIRHPVYPMTDQGVATRVQTLENGELAFQSYFVERQCEPTVTGFRFEGVETSQPAPGVLAAIEGADVILFCPSNPWVSIGPILAVPGIRAAVAAKPVVALSPIIGGKAVKGPAAKMYLELGIEPSAIAVATQYRPFLTGFVLDQVDRTLVNEIAGWGIMTMVTNTLMTSLADRERLAGEILAFCAQIAERI